MNQSDTLENLESNKMKTITNDDTCDRLLDKSQSTSIMETKDLESNNNELDMEVFDRIANKLLRSGLILTALELHAELIERNKESARLREYFDNPHNFEKHFDNSSITKPTFDTIKNVERSPSERTFDSLDFTHNSDDDIEKQGDERIALLEFELRKAQQTINSLRASLTMTTTGHNFDTTTNDIETQDLIKPNILETNNQLIEQYSIRDFYSRGSADGDSCPGEDDKFTKSINFSDSGKFEPILYQTSNQYSIGTLIKPHEKRAINYLINEYLMANNYKLTSITFCDENTDQDFDNWEDVGLNINRPPDLLKLFRNFWQNRSSTLFRTNSNATTVISNKTKVPNDEPETVNDFD